MPAVHNTSRHQQMTRKAFIAHLLERGWGVEDIAAELDTTVENVKYHARSLEQIWLEQILQDISLIKARKIAELAAVKRAAWDAFDKSVDKPVPVLIDTPSDYAGVDDGDTITSESSSFTSPTPQAPSTQSPRTGGAIVVDTTTGEILGEAVPVERKEGGDNEDEPGYDIDETTKVILNKAHKPIPTFGPTSSKYTRDHEHMSEEGFAEFQAAAEQRLQYHRTHTPATQVSLKAQSDEEMYGQKRYKKSRGGMKPDHGEPAYLKIILDAIERESAILGLDAPKRSVDLKLTPDALRQMTDDQLEGLIKRLGGRDMLEDLGLQALGDSIEATRQATGIVEEQGQGPETLPTESDRLLGRKLDNLQS